jgi:hypothetical protein
MGDAADRQPCPERIEQDFPYGLFVVYEKDKRPEYDPKPIAVGIVNHNGTPIIVYQQNAFDKPPQKAGRYFVTEWRQQMEFLEDGSPNPAFVGVVTDMRGRRIHNIAVLYSEEFEPVWAPSET